MKRPISILCLADIHYNMGGDMSAVDSLYKEFTKYIDEDIGRKKWEPDYIVIAGDVADKNGGYHAVAKLLEHLCSQDTFNINKDHVIIVPGNHDKNAKVDVEQMKTDKAIFRDYCIDCKSHKESFGLTFEQRFKEFIEFSKQYSGELQFNNKGNDCVLDDCLKTISGVRVFEEDHLCFLYVNTEWLYYPGRDSAMVLSPGVKDISDFVRLDEDCQLCAPLIKDAFDLINRKYKDYTVITVMHRGFEHFSYKEKNNSDKATIDAVGDILQISDVIITGHDHVFSPAPPALIRNRVQHFQLGATGIKEHPTRVVHRSAEIIRLDLSGETIEQLIIENASNGENVEGNNGNWRFVEPVRKYPLFSKFIPLKESSRALTNCPDVLLRAKSSDENDIKKPLGIESINDDAYLEYSVVKYFYSKIEPYTFLNLIDKNISGLIPFFR